MADEPEIPDMAASEADAPEMDWAAAAAAEATSA